MAGSPSPADRAALDDIVRRLEAGWNAMDGSAFAAPFAEDADFVTIRGEHYRGRPRPEVMLVHVRSDLEAPRGPLAGRHTARFSLVITKESGGWEIAALHNTLEAAGGPPR